MRKIILFLLSFWTLSSAAAQGSGYNTGLMRSHLKIYVVVAVLLIIFTGISLFLLSLERRLKKLENESH
jgi:CcmD family protein